MRVCLMIEGQESVSWEDWRALARACEESPIEALFRSDHYLSVMGATDRGSLDAWAVIAGLAAVTSDLRLGTMVSPATFRHPSVLAKNVVTADHISGGGRVELGMGTGWHGAEHDAYGFPFPPLGERFELLEEQIEIVRREWDEGPFDFEGKHYKVSGNALPKPLSPPNLIVGGGARPRSLRLAARWADEYNLVMMTAEDCAEAVPRVRRAWQDAGRDDPVISLMTSCIIGSDEVDLLERAHATAEVRGDDADDPEAYLEAERPNSLVGTVAQIRDKLSELEGIGVQRVMLQYLTHRDLDGVDYIAELAQSG
ncbi:MAG TPA: LLM class flavin-dependent oxidoreductase [Solirubrobacterales bacterium]|jgi:alkanesulfonate monooxygenase SsuD/methylene tetrahydromethanopterin reductase-like flavin-dependent oxidoreductase (luciferase family)